MPANTTNAFPNAVTAIIPLEVLTRLCNEKLRNWGFIDLVVELLESSEYGNRK